MPVLTFEFQVSSYEVVQDVTVDNVHKHQAVESWQTQKHSSLSFSDHAYYPDPSILIHHMFY
jgi:hypothetical protein